MPTGYTCDIAKGITFKEYALGCARAFGALVTMRDDPSDAAIPDTFEPSSCYRLKAESETKELENILRMTPEETQAAAAFHYAEEKERLERHLSESAALMEKYGSMLKSVEAYIPPSLEHVEFKKFMESQITESIRFDGMSDYYSRALAQLRPLSGQEWRRQKEQELKRSIAYQNEQQAAEDERSANRTRWVQQLKASLA